ncbi:MAG TPA: VWA domain-containing protein [Candidatus Acidoferrales bacterium]|nr:VWA domain-containing protein [Candidatus Acidoferrales bacterium]
MILVVVAAGCSLFAAARRQQSQPAAPPRNPPQQSEGPTIRREITLVDIVATVLNRRRKFVTDLQKEDFAVLEDGKPQEIRYFSRQTDLPLRVGLLLDTSNSIRARIKFEQEAAVDFLYNVIRRKKDRALLMIFDNEPSIIEDFTDNVETLRDAIFRQRAGGGTALYDAIYTACRERLGNPPLPLGDSPEVRRVLVVISDGDDNLSSHSRGEAIEMAQRAGVVVYAISTSTQWVTATEERDPLKRVDRKYHKEAGDKVLDQLADETGGRAFFPYQVDDLAQSFLDIGDELRSQYSIAYVPINRAPDGRFRSIRINVGRKGLIVRARKGYYAPRATAESAKPAARPPGR